MEGNVVRYLQVLTYLTTYMVRVHCNTLAQNCAYLTLLQAETVAPHLHHLSLSLQPATSESHHPSSQSSLTSSLPRSITLTSQPKHQPTPKNFLLRDSQHSRNTPQTTTSTCLMKKAQCCHCWVLSQSPPLAAGMVIMERTLPRLHECS